jgi:hypothetical protein
MSQKKAFFFDIVTVEDETDVLSQNISDTAACTMQQSRRMKISPTLWQKP